jgi:hypothetical protein
LKKLAAVKCRFLAAALAFLATPAAADTLVDKVDGLTLDAEGRPEHFTGLLIGNDGRIAAVLHAGDRRPRADYAVDGRHLVLLPGLILRDSRLMAMALGTITPTGVDPATLPPPRPEDRDLALATLQPVLLSRGITAVTDMGTTIEDWQAYRRAGDEGRLAIRILAYAAGTPAMILIAGPRPTPWLYDDRLRLNGVSLAAPAVLVPAGEVQLKNQISRAAMDHFQVSVHAGPAAEPQVRAAFAELSQTYTGDRRWRIEAPTPSSLTPLVTMASALDRMQALRALTIDAARDAFAEGRLGRIAPGARADFILIDREPETAGSEELARARVLETWIGGRKAWAAASALPPGESR